MAGSIHTDVLIVGAGIAGLMAAHTLREQGLHALVVEKSPRCGGRLATRSMGPGKADYGAQFFTVRKPEFQRWVASWQDDGLVYQWSTGWSDGSLGAVPSNGHPRYAVHGGMGALAERLAQGIDYQLDTHIIAARPNRSGWLARDQRDTTYHTNAILLTPPIPQSLRLLDADEVALTHADRHALEHITYTPCLAGLFWINGEVRLPEPGAVQRPNATITWIADNQRKGISPKATLITVHAGGDYSRHLWNLPDQEALSALESALELFKDYRADVVRSSLERWRYAMPVTPSPNAYLQAEGLPSLVFAGDAFGSPRVEGAAVSGMAAGRALSAHVAV